MPPARSVNNMVPLAADDTKPGERALAKPRRSPQQQCFTSGKQDRLAHAPNVCRLRLDVRRLPCPVADAVPNWRGVGAGPSQELEHAVERGVAQRPSAEPSPSGSALIHPNEPQEGQ